MKIDDYFHNEEFTFHNEEFTFHNEELNFHNEELNFPTLVPEQIFFHNDLL